MGLVKHTIRNLINGVSRQSPSIRLDNQVEEQINMIPDLTLGLTRRNPALLEDSKINNGLFVYDNEDAIFKYTLKEQPVVIGIKSDGTVYRFDADGSNTIITQTQEVKDYLAYTDKKNIVMLETSDSVFLLNREVDTSLDMSDYAVSMSYRSQGNGVIGAASGTLPRTQALYIMTEDSVDDASASFLKGKLFIMDNGKWSIYSPKFSDLYQSIMGADDAFELFSSYVGTVTDLAPNTFNSTVSNQYLSAKLSLIDVNSTSDTIVLPELYSLNGQVRIEKAADGGTAQVSLYINGVVKWSGDIPDGYGNWNDYFGDTLDVVGKLSIEFNGYSCLLKTYQTGGTTSKYYSIEITIDTKKPNSFYVFNVDYTPISEDTYNDSMDSYWSVLPKYASVVGIKKFEYDTTAGAEKYIEVYASGTDVIVNYKDIGSGIDESITVANSTIDTLEVSPLVSTDNSGNPIRLIAGTCIDEPSVDTLHYNVMVQKANISQDTIRTIATIGADSSTQNVNSISDGISVEILYGHSTIFKRDILSSKIPTIFGDAFTYKFYTKATDIGNPRILSWISTATDGVVYTMKLFSQNYDGTIQEIVGMSTSYTAGAADTPKTVNDNLFTQFTGLTDFGNWFDLANCIKYNNTTVWGSKYPYLIMKVETDVGADFGYAVTEANLSNNSAVSIVETLPSVLGTLSKPFIVRVNPDVSSAATNYYLQYTPSNSSWVETAIEGLDVLDAATMPMIINKSETSEIEIKKNDWVIPPAGDNSSNVPPSFLGKSIQDMILFNSRLGFASHDTLIFSQIDDYSNFYRTTTAKVLISDRVDLKLDSSRLGYKKIENIFNMDGKIFINTGETQSVLTLPTDLDLTKAAFNQVSSHNLNSGHPVPMRQTMIFPVYSNGFTSIYNFTPDGTGGFAAVDLTRHCEKYIKGEVAQLLYTDGVVIARTDDDRKTIYVQHSYIKDATLVQNAWHKWVFSYPIKFIYNIGSTLYMIFEDSANDSSYFCSLELTPDVVVEDTETQIGYKPYLDFYTSDESLALSGSLRLNKITGAEEIVDSPDSVYGITYDSSVTLSEIVARNIDQSGIEKLGFARLMLRRMVLNLGYTGRLAITISRTGRDDYVHNYIPKVIGSIIIGREEVSDESARFPVNSRSDDTRIKVSTVDNFVPFSIISIEWQGQLINRGGRL